MSSARNPNRNVIWPVIWQRPGWPSFESLCATTGFNSRDLTFEKWMLREMLWLRSEWMFSHVDGIPCEYVSLMLLLLLIAKICAYSWIFVRFIFYWWFQVFVDNFFYVRFVLYFSIQNLANFSVGFDLGLAPQNFLPAAWHGSVCAIRVFSYLDFRFRNCAGSYVRSWFRINRAVCRRSGVGNLPRKHPRDRAEGPDYKNIEPWRPGNLSWIFFSGGGAGSSGENSISKGLTQQTTRELSLLTVILAGRVFCGWISCKKGCLLQ